MLTFPKKCRSGETRQSSRLIIASAAKNKFLMSFPTVKLIHQSLLIPKFLQESIKNECDDIARQPAEEKMEWHEITNS